MALRCPFDRVVLAAGFRLSGWLVLFWLALPRPGLAAFPFPPTRSEPVVDVLHGVEVHDPYRWLEDSESREVRAWLESQSKYADFILAPLPGREELKRRLTDLMKVEAYGSPVLRGGRYYFVKRPADRDRFAIFCRDGEGPDRMLVDPAGLGPDASVEILDVSDDGLVAYSVRTGGEDEARVRFLDVAAGKDLPDELPKARYTSVSLLPRRRGVYYARQGTEGGRVYFRPPGGEEKEVFGAGYGPDKIVFGNLSDDGRYLVLTVVYGSSARRTEVYVQNLAAGGPVLPVVRDVDAAFFAGMAGDRLVIQTTWQAPNGRIFTADPAHPGRAGWKEIVPERKDATIRSVRTAGGRLFVNYLENVRSRVRIFRLDGRPAGEIALDTIGTVTNVSGRWESRQGFFLFSSFHVPDTIYSYDVETGARQVWARLPAPVESGRYEVEQVWYPSKDGTRVPMFLVHRKGLPKDGERPTLLTGYGGFGASMTPYYSPTAAVWVQSGGVYAVAGLRGGGELGDAWHRAGMLANKQNTFDDFAAAAEWLIRQGYTRPERLAIQGGSNGGLLVGAAVTQRPELFRAAVCSYPLLDMIRYPKFLAGRLWVPEYGSPDDPGQFRALYAYSPYHHVEPGRRYPAVLFISGDGDTRVSPMHARKMTAAMQQTSSEERPVVLRYHSKSGHAGGQPLGDQIDDVTDTVSFLFSQLGVPPGGTEAGAAGSLALEPHTFHATSGAVEAELGRLTVPENRRSGSGRTIELAFVRFRGTAGSSGPPIVFLAGGPGGSGIEAAKGPLFPLFMALRADGDVIALDQRGTGMSRPALVCHESWRLPADRAATAAEVVGVAVEHSRACAGALRADGVDLDAYNVEESAEDLEGLRRALGVPRLRLWSTSYGTQLALTALRRHPEAFDRVVLAGVQGPDQSLRSPREVQRQLEAVARLVQADAQTGAAVPDLLGLMKRVLDRLEREPVTVQVADPIGKSTVAVTVGRFDLQWMTAERLGTRDGIRGLPALYQAMDGGDFGELGKFAFRNRKGWLGSAVPYLTQCATGAPKERLERIRREEGESLLGGVPNFPFPEICLGWGVADLGEGARAPVTSEVPALLISGSLDGRTPPADAEEVGRTLPHGAHLMIDGAAHGNDLLLSSPEIARAIVGFLRGDAVASGSIALPPLSFETAPAKAASARGSE